MLRASRAFVVLSAALFLVPSSALAQRRDYGPKRAGNEPEQDQLRFHLGPFGISPYIRLGSIGVDTNVFLTPEDRRTDFTADGGPGLRIGLPLGRFEMFADGDANYYWFARTPIERHFGGRAGGGFAWSAGAFSLGASRFFTRTYQRPSIEVDRRILRDEWRSQVYVDFSAGARFRLQPSFTIENGEVARQQDYFGTDLGRTLTGDRYEARLDLMLRLTGKTDFVVQTSQDWARHPLDSSRDVDSNRLAAGFAVSSETRLSGRIVAGARLVRPRDRSRRGGDFTRPVGEGLLAWRIGPKTRLSAEYRYETYYSAFDTKTNQLPTVETQTGEVRFNRRITGKIDFDASVRVTTLKNLAPVVIRRGDTEEVIRRDDQYYSSTADLGYRIRERLRIAVVATYNDRQSKFADFGVNGLLVGGSIRFNP